MDYATDPRWASYLQAETLATALQPTLDGTEGYRETIELEGEPATFVLQRVLAGN